MKNGSINRSRTAALLAAALLTASCIKDEYAGPDPTLPSRTVLFYLAEEEGASPQMPVPELLRSVWTYTGNRCLIYYDASDAAPVLLSLRGGCQVWPEPWIETVVEYEDANGASPAVFGRVVRDVCAMYPADSYGLVFTSHASGWLPSDAGSDALRQCMREGEEVPRTMASGVTEFRLADFAAAIPDHRFDFILFEADLMAGVEVACELHDKTRYILASSAEMLAPGFASVYQTASHLFFDTSLPVEQMLVRFAACQFDYMNALNGASRSATLSVIDVREMESLAALTAEIYRNAASTEPSDMMDLQRFDRPGGSGSDPPPRYIDYGDYMRALSPPGFSERLDVLLSRVVVWKAATPEFMAGYDGFAIGSHSGLTTYVARTDLPELNEAYFRTLWCELTRRE